MQRHLLTLAALCAMSPSFLLMPDGGGGGGGACLNTLGLPKWQSHKTVWAGKVAAVSEKEGIPSLILDLGDDQTNIAVGQAWLDRHKPEVGGYFVLYADGYRSYSPAKAFEEGHTPAYMIGEHQGKIGYETFRTHLEGTPNVAPMPGWDDLAKHEATAPFARSWNRAAQAIAATVMANLREYSGPEPSEDPALDLGVNEISNLVHLFENPGSGYRIIKPAGEPGGEDIDLSPDVAKSLRAILVTLGRDVVGYPTPGTIEPRNQSASEADEARTLKVRGAFPIPADNPEHVMRAKLRASRVSPTPDKDAGGSQTVDFNAVGPSQYPDDGSDENNSFAKWSPSASMNITIANPKLFGVIFPGDEFYVDFTLAKKGERPEPPPVEVPAPKPTPADAQPGGEPAAITHLAAKDAAGNDVPTPQNDDVPPGGPVPTPQTAEAPKS